MKFEILKGRDSRQFCILSVTTDEGLCMSTPVWLRDSGLGPKVDSKRWECSSNSDLGLLSLGSVHEPKFTTQQLSAIVKVLCGKIGDPPVVA